MAFCRRCDIELHRRQQYTKKYQLADANLRHAAFEADLTRYSKQVLKNEVQLADQKYSLTKEKKAIS